jgi:uncharacterized protein DUF3105
VSTALERVAIGVASLVLSVGLIAVLSGFFAGRDQAGVAGGANETGLQFHDLGHALLRPGDPRPPYDSNPPTSGAHLDKPVLRDETQLSVDQLLQALQVGDVVIVYGTRKPPPELAKLATDVSGAFTPALAAAGQAVIYARRPGTAGLIALAWTRMVHVRTATDPLLRQFAEQWLGHGAPGRSSPP